MSYTTEGTIETIFPEETHGNNGFKKRVIWLKTEEQYPQTLEVQFTQYNVGLLDGFHNGDRVRVTLGVNGRKTEKDGKERVFNSLNGFGIAKI